VKFGGWNWELNKGIDVALFYGQASSPASRRGTVYISSLKKEFFCDNY
jgi:hypothetical protein